MSPTLAKNNTLNKENKPNLYNLILVVGATYDTYTSPLQKCLALFVFPFKGASVTE